ncbi:HEAT repeat domain-containing protein [Solemya pervernicosa gill symbiont]|nr:HEAT repeat domain-containing protein [Solemya pervernicosa gill symbiont]
MPKTNSRKNSDSPNGLSDIDVPELINLVLNKDLQNASGKSNDVWGPLHSWRALGQIGSPDAVEPLLSMFDYLENDDWALEELPIVMGMLGEASLNALSEYLRQATHKEFARAMAADGIKEVAMKHSDSREQSVSILIDYLKEPDSEARLLNAMVVSSLIDLDAKEAIGTIRGIYEAGLADLVHCGDIEDVELELGLRESRSTPRPDLFSPQTEYTPVISHESNKTKIGRNDQCPCGSGKKYKKCCLH